MRLGLSSIVGDGFGTGSFGVDGPSTPPSYPPAGTYYDTQYGVEYPIAEGGAYLISPVDSSQVPNQVCDVDREHDGSGGIVYDWATATNVQYKSAGTTFYNAGGGSNTVYVSELGGYYPSYTWNNLYYQHDGFGGYQSPDDGSYTNAGTVYGYYNSGNTGNQVLVSQDATYHDNQYYLTEITADGVGGYSSGSSTSVYYDINDGPFHSIPLQTEVPSAGTLYNNGKSDVFYHDGSGGYTTQTEGSFYSNGTFIFQDPSMTEVPSGSSSYYQNGVYTNYYWDGSGSYYDNGQGSHYSYGTFIYNDGTYDYYWDGSGGYYT